MVIMWGDHVQINVIFVLVFEQLIIWADHFVAHMWEHFLFQISDIPSWSVSSLLYSKMCSFNSHSLQDPNRGLAYWFGRYCLPLLDCALITDAIWLVFYLSFLIYICTNFICPFIYLFVSLRRTSLGYYDEHGVVLRVNKHVSIHSHKHRHGHVCICICLLVCLYYMIFASSFVIMAGRDMNVQMVEWKLCNWDWVCVQLMP